MTNQEDRVQSIIDNYGLTNENTHDGYYMQMFTLEGITFTTFNGGMIAWLQSRLTTTETDINNLKQQFASDSGFDNWDSVNDLFATALGDYQFQNGVDYDFQNLTEYDFN